jgi:hypothetical protein
MWMLILRAAVAAALVALIPELAKRYPRLGALILTLPYVRIVATLFTWLRQQEAQTVATFCRETLILVPLGLPFFVPLAFMDRLGLNFWLAFAIGIALAATPIGLWLRFGRRQVEPLKRRIYLASRMPPPSCTALTATHRA